MFSDGTFNAHNESSWCIPSGSVNGDRLLLVRALIKALMTRRSISITAVFDFIQNSVHAISNVWPDSLFLVIAPVQIL